MTLQQELHRAREHAAHELGHQDHEYSRELWRMREQLDSAVVESEQRMGTLLVMGSLLVCVVCETDGCESAWAWA